MILFLISFIAGVLTVLAPCVLPLLPVIVGGSLSTGTNWRRAYAICLSLGASVIIFTLLLKATTAFIAIPQTFWQVFSGLVIVLFGVTLLAPSLWDRLGFVNAMNRSSNRLLASGYQRNSLWGDLLMGAALGPVFSSCSPTYFIILATVLPASFAMGILDLIAYAIGLSGFLFVIALLGQRLIDRLGIAIEPGGWFRRSIGILFIIVGFGVLTGLEARLEAYLLDRGFDVTVLEQRLLGANKMDAAATTTTALLSPAEKAKIYPPAPELAKPDGYINTGGEPITIGQFKGKNVVLVDFWTYSCINCIRTIPYVEMWYQKYRDQGLVVIGVHTPEFAFEHIYGNVLAATKQLGITYPVVQDNEYQTWNAFGNQFWPREYLIDIDGFVVHDHAGEGDYDATEAAIQKALAERAARLGESASSTAISAPGNAIPIQFNGVQSPETYFGAARNEYLGNGSAGQTGDQFLQEPQTVEPNTLYLIGAWSFSPQYAETSETVGGTSGSDRIDYRYSAKNVYFVAGAAKKPVTVEVLRDSKPLDTALAGKDVYFKDGRSYVQISEERLYDLVKGESYGDHFLELIISQPGLQAYTFTFG